MAWSYIIGRKRCSIKSCYWRNINQDIVLEWTDQYRRIVLLLWYSRDINLSTKILNFLNWSDKCWILFCQIRGSDLSDLMVLIDILAIFFFPRHCHGFVFKIGVSLHHKYPPLSLLWCCYWMKRTWTFLAFAVLDEWSFRVFAFLNCGIDVTVYLLG